MYMDLYESLMVSLAILSASAVLGILFAGKRKLAGWINFLLTLVAGSMLLSISYNAIFVEASAATKLFDFGITRIYFLVDAFSGFFIGIISLMAILTAFYSIEYMEHYKDYSLRRYYLNFQLFLIGMILLVTVDDLSTGFTIAWQLMTIASYFLVKFEFRKQENIRSANKYLILMELAWVLIIGATLLINGIGYNDPIHTITEKIAGTDRMYVYIIYGLLFVGFAFKAGVFPFGQLWLPDAHSIAPSPISALLSGVMIKTGVYGIIRTFFWLIPQNEAELGYIWGIVIASFGVVTLFIGTTQALKQNDAKRLHAYHSIGQMGYIVFAIGCSLVMFNTDDQLLKLLAVVSIIGALYHTLNHTIFKGLLFLSTGSVLYATDTKDLNKLGGLIKIMPVTALVAGIASLSIAGMPSFSGFVSKWTIISASLLSGQNTIYLVMFGIVALFTSAITLASYVKFYGMTFTSSGSTWNVKKNIKEVPGIMILPKVILAVLCVVQGLLPYFYYDMFFNIFKKSEGSIIHAAFNSLDFNSLINNSLMGVTLTIPVSGTAVSGAVVVPVVTLIIIIIAVIFAVMLKKSGGSTEKEAETWLCGYQDLNNLNRYKSKNMYSAFKKVVHWTGGNQH